MKITLGVIGKCKAGSPEGEIIARYAERMKWNLNIREKDNTACLLYTSDAADE